jgi:plastocyanin
VLKKRLPALSVVIGLGLVLVSLPLMGACTPKEVTSPTGEFTVEGSEFKYSPVRITVSQGDEVKIIFNNVGEVIHNFVIDEFGVETPILQPGETATVEFTADQVGTFFFYCPIPFSTGGTHRTAGMEGEITVK